jgi:hypothetical protein
LSGNFFKISKTESQNQISILNFLLKLLAFSPLCSVQYKYFLLLFHMDYEYQPDEQVLITLQEKKHQQVLRRMSNTGFLAGAMLAFTVVIITGTGLFYYSILQSTASNQTSVVDEISPHDAPPSYFTKDRKPLIGFPVTENLKMLRQGDILGVVETGTITIVEITEQTDTSFETEKWSALVSRATGATNALDQALSFGDQQKRVYAHQVLSIGFDYWFIHAITQDSLLLAKFANPDEARIYPLVWQE